jgi:glycosyltransferase involved in cell wall biosynthesis
MRKKIDLSLVLACYNEAPIFFNSVSVIDHVLSLSRLNFELIFVDDKSRDATSFLIKQILVKHPKWKGVFHRENLGRGAAVESGIRKARGDVVGYIDIDLEVSPIYISQMVDLIRSGKSDIVLGHRTYRTTISSLTREIFSRGYLFWADMMLHTGNLDTESGYKFFNRKKIMPILGNVKHRHWFWDTEIVVYSKMAGLRISEIPVLFIRRFDKVSSVKIFTDIPDYIRSVWELWRRLL